MPIRVVESFLEFPGSSSPTDRRTLTFEERDDCSTRVKTAAHVLQHDAGVSYHASVIYIYTYFGEL